MISKTTYIEFSVYWYNTMLSLPIYMVYHRCFDHQLLMYETDRASLRCHVLLANSKSYVVIYHV